MSSVLITLSKRGPWILRWTCPFGVVAIGFVLGTVLLSGSVLPAFSQTANGGMTEDQARALAEEFGVDIEEVNEEIQEMLGLTKAEGVVVYEVIGGTAAHRAFIQPKTLITEVDGIQISTILDLGYALKKALQKENFTLHSYEPPDMEGTGSVGGPQFHIVTSQKN